MPFPVKYLNWKNTIVFKCLRIWCSHWNWSLFNTHHAYSKVCVFFAYSNCSVFKTYQCGRKAETNRFCSVFIQIRSNVNGAWFSLENVLFSKVWKLLPWAAEKCKHFWLATINPILSDQKHILSRSQVGLLRHGEVLNISAAKISEQRTVISDIAVWLFMKNYGASEIKRNAFLFGLQNDKYIIPVSQQGLPLRLLMIRLWYFTFFLLILNSFGHVTCDVFILLCKLFHFPEKARHLCR